MLFVVMQMMKMIRPKHTLSNRSAGGLTLGATIVLLQLTSPVQAASLNLAWNASSDSRTTGYQVAYGTSSGRYTNQIDVGNKTTANVANLNDGTTYYFAVTGYNSAKSIWSTYSNEVKTTTSGSQAQPVAQSATPSNSNTSSGGQIYGGSGGSNFADAPDASQTVTGFTVNSGWALDKVQTHTSAGSLPSHGGSGGHANNVALNNGEYVVSVAGRYNNYISELTLVTNTGRVFGPYGQGLDPDGSPATGSFRLNAASGNEIAGFTGRAGSFVNALGIAQRQHKTAAAASAPAPTTAPSVQATPQKSTATTSTSGSSVSDIAGGSAGTAFRDRITSRSDLTRIVVRSGWAVDNIEAIGTGGSLGGHGGGGGAAQTVQLAPGEYLVRVWGRYANTVSEINFETNTGQVFGPYGEGKDPDGTRAWATFNFDAGSGNEISGFTGRSSQFLNAIGVTKRPL